MPSNEANEMPGERVMRQHYQGRIAERMLQVAEMAKDRELMRRGARRQQDGTLGQTRGAGDTAEEDERMQIRVGDEVHYHSPALETQDPPERKRPGSGNGTRRSSLLRTIGIPLVAAALGASGVGIPWLLGTFYSPVSPPAKTEPDRWLEMTIEKYVPDSAGSEAK